MAPNQSAHIYPQKRAHVCKSLSCVSSRECVRDRIVFICHIIDEKQLICVHSQTTTRSACKFPTYIMFLLNKTEESEMKSVL